MNTLSKSQPATMNTPPQPSAPPGAQEQPENSVTRPAVRGRPFAKGRSGNPAGRPRGAASLRAGIRRKLSRADCEAIGARLIGRAKTGDVRAVKLLAELLGEIGPGVAVNVAQTAEASRTIEICWPHESRPFADVPVERLRAIIQTLETTPALPPPEAGGNGGGEGTRNSGATGAQQRPEGDR